MFLSRPDSEPITNVDQLPDLMFDIGSDTQNGLIRELTCPQVKTFV